jgi:hypothetical protein
MMGYWKEDLEINLGTTSTMGQKHLKFTNLLNYSSLAFNNVRSGQKNV